MTQCVTPSQLSRGWNINQLSIGFTFRLNLRFRLTHSRRTLLWNPWTFGVKDFNLQSLLMPTFLLLYTPPYLVDITSSYIEHSSTILLRESSVSVDNLSLVTFSAHTCSASELLRTL